MKKVDNLSQIELDCEGLKFEGTPQDARKTNIVIGKNGAGKSRFLHALNKHYENQTTYCDFTKLVSSSVDQNQKETHEQDVSLYDHGRFHSEYYPNEILEIQYTADEYLNRIITKTSAKKEKLYSDNAFFHFSEHINKILGYKVSVDSGTVYFEKGDRKNQFNKALNEFSPGELFIFYFIVFETLHQDDNEKSVLILDEPECHLHAAALREFIKFIKGSNAFEQVWIATL